MTALSNVTFVLGGARSGKTAYAQQLVQAQSAQRVYIATAQAFDAEMGARIATHQAERQAGWRTVEAPLDLAAALRGVHPTEAILLDCLTLWLSNLMHHDQDLEAASDALLTALADSPAPVTLVSNELGLGLVPETALGRTFRDAQGRLNQQMAAVANTVTFVTAGLPLPLKTPILP